MAWICPNGCRYHRVVRSERRTVLHSYASTDRGLENELFDNTVLVEMDVLVCGICKSPVTWKSELPYTKEDAVRDAKMGLTYGRTCAEAGQAGKETMKEYLCKNCGLVSDLVATHTLKDEKKRQLDPVRGCPRCGGFAFLVTRPEKNSEVKKNTYRVFWQRIRRPDGLSDDTILTSAEIDVPVAGDVVIEHINVLSQFHAIFRPSPPPVQRILEVRLVRENW